MAEGWGGIKKKRGGKEGDNNFKIRAKTRRRGLKKKKIMIMKNMIQIHDEDILIIIQYTVHFLYNLALRQLQSGHSNDYIYT